jgi:acyl phosphate:glycerol-3-phosphate acyltransferase
MPTILFLILASYLLGSIPFGVIVTRLAGAEDIRKIGSGSIGATNVLRTGRRGLALATLIGDSAKGAIAALGAGWWLGPDAAALAGGAAFLGHLYPVWLGFKGGKGVATAAGVLLAVAWPVGLGCGAMWLISALFFRISSLAALITALAAPALFWAMGQGSPARYILCGGMVVLILWKHRSNIARLRAGTEPRIGAR